MGVFICMSATHLLPSTCSTKCAPWPLAQRGALRASTDPIPQAKISWKNGNGHRIWHGRNTRLDLGVKARGLQQGRLCEEEARSLRSLATVYASTQQQLVDVSRRAADVVEDFYEFINQRDYIGVTDLFAEDCVYEDFNFAKSKKGKKEVLKFFQTVMSSFGTELRFAIDDMTRDDPNAVGVIWHLDWRGKAFPFSRGCSFYRCEVNSEGTLQIKYARDIVEPAAKPGNVAMGAIRLVTALFERFPQLADRL